MDKVKSQIKAAIDAANRGRRTRQIEHRDVCQVLREAQNWDSYGFACGGLVGNAYKYPATTASAYAIQFAPAHFALVIGSRDGRKNSSETTWATGAASNDIAGQRAAFGPRINHREAIFLTRAEVARVLRAEKRAEVGSIPDVKVSVSLSLAAGNCELQTRRVQELCGGVEEMPARQVAAKLRSARLENLLPYLKRAAQYAQAVSRG